MLAPRLPLALNGPGFLLLVLAAAVLVRSWAAGGDPSSPLAGIGAAAVLSGGCWLWTSARAGRRRARPRVALLRSAGWGLAGFMGLAVGPLGRGRLPGPLHSHGAGLALWLVAVSVIALAEEAMLRHSLWTAIESAHGPAVALVVTSIAFAVIHVPLYGWAVLPLDLVVGFWLGGLRLVAGSALAPALAHVAADWLMW